MHILDDRKTRKDFCILCDALVLRLSPAGPAFLESQRYDEIFEIFPGLRNELARTSLPHWLRHIDLNKLPSFPNSHDKKRSRVPTKSFSKFSSKIPVDSSTRMRCVSRYWSALFSRIELSPRAPHVQERSRVWPKSAWSQQISPVRRIYRSKILGKPLPALYGITFYARPTKLNPNLVYQDDYGNAKRLIFD